MITEVATPRVLIPPRYSATNAKDRWVKLLEWVAATGQPVEITRQRRRSLILVSALGFEARIGQRHRWETLKVRWSPRLFHPNGLVPGVLHRWPHRSSTAVRDQLTQTLAGVDGSDQPLLVTRRGKSGLLLISLPLFLAHWNVAPTEGGRR